MWNSLRIVRLLTANCLLIQPLLSPWFVGIISFLYSSKTMIPFITSEYLHCYTISLAAVLWTLLHHSLISPLAKRGILSIMQNCYLQISVPWRRISTKLLTLGCVRHIIGSRKVRSGDVSKKQLLV